MVKTKSKPTRTKRKVANKSGNASKTAKIIIAFVVGLLLIGLIVFFFIDAEEEIDKTVRRTSRTSQVVEHEPETVEGIEQDPELLSILRSLGATALHDVSLRYADNLEEDTDGEYEEFYNESGEFSHGEVAIARGLDAEELKRTLAHEYLHHVWYAVLDENERNELTSYLIVMYGDDEYMKQYTMTDYAEDGVLLPTELFSFYCTESSDAYLHEVVLNSCNEFIDRSKLVMLR